MRLHSCDKIWIASVGISFLLLTFLCYRNFLKSHILLGKFYLYIGITSLWLHSTIVFFILQDGIVHKISTFVFVIYTNFFSAPLLTLTSASKCVILDVLGGFPPFYFFCCDHPVVPLEEASENPHYLSIPVRQKITPPWWVVHTSTPRCNVILFHFTVLTDCALKERESPTA